MFISREKLHIYIIYLLIFEVTFILWVLAIPPDMPMNVFRALTQLTGLLAVSFVGLNLILSSRLKFIENLLGGLDSVYKEHQATGKIAFSLILAHPIFFIILNLGNTEHLKTYFLTFEIMPSNWGKAAVLVFTILTIMALFARINFETWLLVHKLMILPVVFTTMHVATVSAEIMTYLPLRYVTLGTLYAGIAIYVYKVFLYNFIGPKAKYKIAHIRQIGKIIEIFLTPISGKLNFEPGQFVFARVLGKRSHEEHPFSISSSPGEEYLRLSVKMSGDFTSAMGTLKTGEEMTLYGPYGHFGKYAITSKKDLVFIAGGIGLTPFLSIIRYMKIQNMPKNYKLIFTLKNAQDSPYVPELTQIAAENLVVHYSETSGHLNAETIIHYAGGIDDKLILICGPKHMMKDIVKGLLEKGVKRRNIIFEDFDMR